MKVKVKGLVFAGFAAAVFAQSAMADAAQDAADMKTVTSKYYVDSKFNGTAGQVIIQGANRGDTTYKTVATTGTGDNNDFTNNETNNAKLPTVGAVRQYVDNAVSSGVGALNPQVGSNATNYATFAKDGNNLTVNFSQAPATTAAGITGSDGANDGTTLVTVGAIRGAVVETVSSTSTDAQIPTAAAVYSYAQDKTKLDGVTESDNGQGGTTYGNTTISASSYNDEYPSSMNVYKFVTGAIAASETADDGKYQDKLTSLQTGLYVGTYSGGDSTWKGLQVADADATGGTAALSGTNYVAKTYDSTTGVYTINLDATQVGTASTDVADSGTKLLTGNAVYDYIDGITIGTGTGGVSDGFGSGASDTNVPSIANVKAYVTEQIAALPTSTAASSMPSECSTGTSYCALVAYKSGNSLVYEWTVMAPVPAAQQPEG
jgi:hypothetical protein